MKILNDYYWLSLFNWNDAIEIYELILPKGKILNRRQIEKLWEKRT
jgi:hypothetical protein